MPGHGDMVKIASKNDSIVTSYYNNLVPAVTVWVYLQFAKFQLTLTSHLAHGPVLIIACLAATYFTSTMPASNYRVVEPHPSVPHNTRPAVYTGRGGQGNVISLKNTRTTDSRTATGPASLTRLDSRAPSTFTSGRGGAGNVHSSSERAIFSFDEELERDLRRAAPVYHVGRGGAGNMMYRDDAGSCLTRKYSACSTATNSSTGSVADRARDMARRGLEKGWGKLKGAA